MLVELLNLKSRGRKKSSEVFWASCGPVGTRKILIVEFPDQAFVNFNACWAAQPEKQGQKKMVKN